MRGSKGPRDATSQPLPCAEAALGLAVCRKTSHKTSLNESLSRSRMGAAAVEFQLVCSKLCAPCPTSAFFVSLEVFFECSGTVQGSDKTLQDHLCSKHVGLF